MLSEFCKSAMYQKIPADLTSRNVSYNKSKYIPFLPCNAFFLVEFLTGGRLINTKTKTFWKKAEHRALLQADMGRFASYPITALAIKPVLELEHPQPSTHPESP